MKNVNTPIEELKIILSKFLLESNKLNSKSFEEAFNDYLRWAEYNLSSASIRNIKISAKHFLTYRGNVNLNDVNSLFIDNFIIELMKKAPKGYRVYFRTLKAMFQKFVHWNFISKNPFTEVKLPKQQVNEKKFFDNHSFISLISNEKNRKLRLLFLFDFYTGLRLGEIANLKWQDVNLKGKYISVGNENFQTKSRKVRKVPLNDVALSILEELKSMSHNSSYVFCKSNSFPFTTDYISKRFKKLLRANGYDENYSFHSIRHSTASNLACIGVPIPIIQQILGHSDIKTTMIYTHTNFNDVLSAIQKLNEINIPQEVIDKQN
ncbi:site-specific integrase [Ignavibacteria bacterium 4148-Me]|uniref:tyrosine-type recombinase/integrase n=1 Tax=Rosettibacter primus TaxID=3111523 RepID=UPI00336C27DA